MPYDFYHNRKYSFNFALSCEPLAHDEYFKNQKEYLRRWVYIFQILEQIDDMQRADAFKQSVIGEYYQFKLHFDNQDYILHFNVEQIKNDIVVNPLRFPTQIVSTKYFGTSGSDAKIIYTKEVTVSNKKGPIIICPLIIGNSEFVVIDGNHRISKNIRDKEKSTELIAYNPNSHKCFLSLVDWAMFLFKAEIYTICVDYNDGKNFDSLIAQSHAYTTFKDI